MCAEKEDHSSCMNSTPVSLLCRKAERLETGNMDTHCPLLLETAKEKTYFLKKENWNSSELKGAFLKQ